VLGEPRRRASTILDDRRLYALAIALLAAVYYGAAKLGLSLAFTTPSVTAVWPPTGIALAAVLLLGYRMWPGIALGAFLANAWTDVPLYTTLGITAGNTLEALTGAFLLNRLAEFRPTLERLRDVIALFVLGGVISTMVSATIGTTSVLIGDEIMASDFGVTWRTWWLGDMCGDLVVGTALLVMISHWPYRGIPGGRVEALALGALVGGTTALVFTTDVPLTFILIPPLVLVALRLEQPGAVLGCLLVASIAIPLTESDHGPFAGESPDDRLLLAQGVTGIASLTSLILAAVISERRRVEYTLERISGTLQAGLLPTELPEIPGVETEVYYRPAGEHQIVGGDFYDVFQAEDGSWAVVVGDVVGKGAAAAATTALARYTLRAAAVHESRPSRILAELNDAIRRQAPDQSCTAAYLRVEAAGGRSVRAMLATGGHPSPLLLRGEGTVERFNLGSLVLGVEEDAALADRSIQLRPGDALLLYTDGLTDAYAPRRIASQDDLAALLIPLVGLDASQIVQHVTRAMLPEGWGRPRDDILLFVLRVPL
jgi:integral membrane sensor domain MASE1/serine phosphatase RsbU (regulator of sigma subunit)